jgi:hypothetical protein
MQHTETVRALNAALRNATVLRTNSLASSMRMSAGNAGKEVAAVAIAFALCVLARVYVAGYYWCSPLSCGVCIQSSPS